MAESSRRLDAAFGAVGVLLLLEGEPEFARTSRIPAGLVAEIMSVPSLSSARPMIPVMLMPRSARAAASLAIEPGSSGS